MTIAAIIFWTSVSAVGFAYIGYPILLGICTFWRADAADKPLAVDGFRTPQDWPFVTLIIAAYKEERHIVERLMNAVTQDYPADRFEIIVGCDGREDQTGELVESFGDERIRLMQFPQRRGKASVLNDCVPAARGRIVVFSDANTMMHPEALRRLVRHFAEAHVGGVVGKLELKDPVTGQNVDGIYWKYENFLKRCEGRLGALLGANGGIYAIRKNLYRAIPANTIIDDFVIGMRIHEQGYDLVYDAGAIAYEETPETVDSEFHRRARIGAGGFQSLPWLASLLRPSHGWLAFAFFSHKVLRWICPVFLAAALVTNILLSGRPEYFALLIVQELFYVAAIAARFSTGQRWQRPLRIPAMFLSMNLALVVGFWRFLRGIRSGTWKRTERTETPPVEKINREKVLQ
jgi:cellulose synthase/poly-beta-1,6-N-acetylglucosamine synthase-like glycosyltransferase